MAYIWGCSFENHCSDWADHWRCGACSKKKFKTEKEAIQAARQHASREGHHGHTWVKKVHGNIKLQ